VGTFMLDYDGQVLLWSASAEEILGWSAEEVVGRRLGEFLRPDEAAEPATAARRHAVLEEAGWRGLLHLRHRDGHFVEVELLFSLRYAGGTDAVQLANIVETRRLHAIEHDLAALDALFSSSPLGFAVFDTELRYVRVNEALARVNRLSRGEHLGKTVHEVLPARLADEVWIVLCAVLETGRPIVDRVATAPDGVTALSVSYHRITDHKGEVIGCSCVAVDITERRAAARKVEAATQRLSLLDDVGVALADRFDVASISQGLAGAVVPRFADYASVHLRTAIARGAELPGSEEEFAGPLLHMGAAARHSGGAVDRMQHMRQDVRYEAGSRFARALHEAEPQLVNGRAELAEITYPGDPRVQAALDLGVESVLVLPLRAGDTVLGLLVVGRAEGRPPYDEDDLALGVELSKRAGISLDNARLYARERAGALMLQRSLLPQRVPEPPGVDIAYRYVPGSSGTEVGGDWFDVVPLAGGRVALVVGDVTGHGLRAAVAMGRLRMAVRTLAALDLPPEELLRRMNELVQEMPQDTEDTPLATCLYAVYDPSTRRCTLAAAGHPPPLLLSRTPEGGWDARTLELPSGVPLGVNGAAAPVLGGIGEGMAFEAVDLDVAEGSVLVLYTDGLVERRGESVAGGIEQLRRTLACGPEDAYTTLEGACDRVIRGLHTTDGTRTEDDVALLLARLGELPAGSSASWTFEGEEYSVRLARRAVRRTLHEWGLDALEDAAVLLVSELVTNSLRHAHGPVGVRMVRGGSLLVEVTDPLPDPPRERGTTPDDEGGRGIQLVVREARRWGTRHGTMGKTVWFELALPAGADACTEAGTEVDAGSGTGSGADASPDGG